MLRSANKGMHRSLTVLHPMSMRDVWLPQERSVDERRMGLLGLLAKTGPEQK